MMNWSSNGKYDDVLVVPQNKGDAPEQSQLDSWFNWAEGSGGLSNMCGKYPRIDYGTDGFSDDWPYDQQMDGLKGTDQSNNNFMNVLPGTTLSTVEDVYPTIPLFPVPDWKCSLVPFANSFLTEMVIDGISYLNSPQLPPTINWNIPADAILPLKAVALKVLAPEKLCGEDIAMEVEISVEATVLKELAVVMTQLTQKTRICFRDALYRFAKSSENKHLESQNQSLNVEVSKKKSRSSTVKLIELESNKFDLTLANLLFNNQNCDALGNSCVTSTDLSEGVVTTDTSCNCNFDQLPPYE